MAEGIQHQQLVPGVGVGVPVPRGVKRESELEQPMSGGDGAESGQSKRLRTEAEADGGGMQVSSIGDGGAATLDGPPVAVKGALPSPTFTRSAGGLSGARAAGC